MPIDISKYAEKGDFDLETHALGQVRCGFLSVNAFSAIEKLLAEADIDGRSLTRNLIIHVGTRITGEGQRPDKEEHRVPISFEETNQLTDEEIESFAREFLSHNTWLLQSQETTTHTAQGNDKKERAVSAGPAPVDFPRIGGETNSQYLLRVIRNYIDEWEKRLNYALKPHLDFFSKGLLPASTQELLKENFALSDRLNGSIADFTRKLITAQTSPSFMGSPEIKPLSLPPVTNPLYETNHQLRQVLSHMGGMRPLVAESAELIRSMNRVALQMIVDFGQNARRTERHTWVMIVIAVASLMITAIFSWWSYKDSQDRSIENTRLLESYQATIQVLTSSQDARVEKLIESIQLDTIARSQKDRQTLIIALTKALRSAHLEALPKTTSGLSQTNK